MMGTEDLADQFRASIDTFEREVADSRALTERGLALALVQSTPGDREALELAIKAVEASIAIYSAPLAGAAFLAAQLQALPGTSAGTRRFIRKQLDRAERVRAAHLTFEIGLRRRLWALARSARQAEDRPPLA